MAHQSWINYMNEPSKGSIGSVVACYIAGEAAGALMQSFIGDYLGRIRFMQLIGMISIVPIYLSEIAAPQSRGLIGSISGCGVSLGTMASNWVGLACSYAPYGQTQWRLPLGLQIPWGLILFIGLATFMPSSPRQLIRWGRIEDARLQFKRTRHDLNDHEADEEFADMQSQIEYEMRREIKSLKEVFIKYRHRALVLTGVNVIQATILFKSLGISGHTILLLVGVYGTIAFISNVLTATLLADQWGRRKMILAGLSAIVVVEIYTAVMQRQFQDTDNKLGKIFTVLGIYLFVVAFYGMLNSTTWLYGAEVLPIALRAKIMGLASASHFIVNVGITQAGPSAFANIRENYYYVFVACTSFFVVVAYFYFPRVVNINISETKQKTLEEIAASFGDQLVLHDSPGSPFDGDVKRDNGETVHLERNKVV
ncbi:hypothetical protein H9L39_18691 [Fusarium oxysporum f. sp. albedinis]|nr:hypothetical protein H9L39_18691 [Fusarium oxysporum f. sp. albedinis]